METLGTLEYPKQKENQTTNEYLVELQNLVIAENKEKFKNIIKIAMLTDNIVRLNAKLKQK